jgi:hypothetical protein
LKRPKFAKFGWIFAYAAEKVGWGSTLTVYAAVWFATDNGPERGESSFSVEDGDEFVERVAKRESL